MLDEQTARGALPSRVGARKVLAHVPGRGGAEQGVADGVEDAVAVGMAFEAAVEGDVHSAQQERPARDQTVGVESVAYAEAHAPAPSCGPRQDALGPGQVFRGRELAVAGPSPAGPPPAAPRRSTAMASSVTVTRSRKACFVGSDQEAEPKALRGLGRAQLAAIEGLHHPALAHPLHRVDHGQHRQGRARARRPPRPPLRSGYVGKGTRRVVNEHDAVEGHGRLLQAREHRVLPAGSRPG